MEEVGQNTTGWRSRKDSSVFYHLHGRELQCNVFQDRALGAAASKRSTWVLQRMKLLHTLDSHRGCVNSVVWNESGSLLVSGSDDHRLVVTNPFSKKVLADVETAHRANIFSAKFLPATSDAKIVSCAGDGTLLFTDLNRQDETRRCIFTCHYGTAYELQVVPGDPNTFLSCGEDGTVRWFDLRTKEKCEASSCKEDVLIWLQSPVTSICMNPLQPYNLAVGSSDSCVRIFDRRMLSTGLEEGKSRSKSLEALISRFSVPDFQDRPHRITSVQYRPDGQEILVSYSSDYVYVFNPTDTDPTRSKTLYVGKQNRQPSDVSGKKPVKGPPPMKRLRLRGDWSDTGPNARPESEESPPAVQTPEGGAGASSGSEEEAVNALEQAANDDLAPAHLMQRMTDALSRMLNDPSTRIAMRRLQASREQQRRRLLSSPQEEEQAGSDDQEESSHNQRQVPGDRERNQEQASATRPCPVEDTIENDEKPETETCSTLQRLSKEGSGEGSAASVDDQVSSASGKTAGRDRQSEGEDDARETVEEAAGTSDTKNVNSRDEEAKIYDEMRAIHASKSSQSHETLLANEPNDDDSEVEKTLAHQDDPNQEESSQQPPLQKSACQSDEVSTDSTVEEVPDSNIQEAGAACSQVQVSENVSLVDAAPTKNEESEDSATDEEEGGGEQSRVDDLQNSFTSFCQGYVGRHSSEPIIGLHFGSQGMESSTVSLLRPPQRPSPQAEAVLPDPLPGPSQVVTHPGDSSTHPVTGQRQRRRGVSGPPTGPSVDPSNDDTEQIENICEFEDDDAEEETARPIIQPPISQKFVGHRNSRTMIKEACWWGNDFILSGSDCGHIFGWDRWSGRLVLLLQADRHVVNCVRPHPFDPILASSGIDYNVKLWAPIKEEPEFNHENADMLVRRNELMLEETRDTITVPATLMIRMLASLNQLRRAGRLLPDVLERRRAEQQRRLNVSEDEEEEVQQPSEEAHHENSSEEE